MGTILSKFIPQVRHLPLEREAGMLESALYLEDLTRLCFQSIGEVIRNGRIQRECQLHSKEAMLNQNQLKSFLKDAPSSQAKIALMHRNYSPDPAHLSVLGIVDVALHAVLQKWSIYKYLITHTSGLKSTKILSKAIQRTWKEIKFLKNEERFQKNKHGVHVAFRPGWPAVAGDLF